MSSDDGDLLTGLDSDSLHSDTDLLSTEYEDSDICDEWSESDGEVLKKQPRLDVVAAASSAISSRTRSRGRGKRYVTARRKTGNGKCNGGPEVSSDKEDYVQGHIVGRAHRRGGADSSHRGSGGAGAGCSGVGGRGRGCSRGRGGGGAGCGGGGRGRGQGRGCSRGRRGSGRRGKLVVVVARVKDVVNAAESKPMTLCL